MEAAETTELAELEDLGTRFFFFRSPVDPAADRGEAACGGGHKTQGIMGGCGLQSQGGAAHKRCCAQEDVPKVRTKKKMRVQHGTLTHKTQGQQGQANQGGAFRSTAGGF